jgi:hypothetical protein
VDSKVTRLMQKVKDLLQDRSAIANDIRGVESDLDSFNLGLQYTKFEDVTVIFVHKKLSEDYISFLCLETFLEYCLFFN